MGNRIDGIIAMKLLEKFDDFEEKVFESLVNYDKRDHWLPSKSKSIIKVNIVYDNDDIHNYQFNLLLKVEAGKCTVSTWVEEVDGDGDAMNILEVYPNFLKELEEAAKKLEGSHSFKTLGITEKEPDDELFG